MKQKIIATILLAWMVLGTEFSKAQEAVEPDSSAVQVLHLDPLDGKSESPVITALALDPHGKWIAAAGDDHAIRVIDFKTGMTVKTLRGHSDWVQAVEFTSDGHSILSCGNDRQLWRWDSQLDWSGRILMKADNALYCVRVHPTQDMIATAGFGSRIWLRKLSSGETIRTLQCDSADHRSLAYSHDGSTFACGSRDGNLHLWNASSGELLREVKLHQERIRSIEFSADDSIISTVGEDRYLMRYDIPSDATIVKQRLKGGKLLAMTSLTADCLAIAGSDDVIQLYCTKNNVIKLRASGHEGSISVLRANSDWLVSGSFDTSIRLWKRSELDQQASRFTSTDAVTPNGPIVETSSSIR